jgi:hypothetical protein
VTGQADYPKKHNGVGDRFTFCSASPAVWQHWKVRNGGLGCAPGSVFLLDNLWKPRFALVLERLPSRAYDGSDVYKKTMST